VRGRAARDPALKGLSPGGLEQLRDRIVGEIAHAGGERRPDVREITQMARLLAKVDARLERRARVEDDTPIARRSDF
jgi:hypothetical protein